MAKILMIPNTISPCGTKREPGTPRGSFFRLCKRLAREFSAMGDLKSTGSYPCSKQLKLSRANSRQQRDYKSGFWTWTGRKTRCTFQMQRYTHRWNRVQSHWINEGEAATINYNCVNSFLWRLDLDCHMAVVVVYFLFIKRSRTR